jgi:hypothetical protein
MALLIWCDIRASETALGTAVRLYNKCSDWEHIQHGSDGTETWRDREPSISAVRRQMTGVSHPAWFLFCGQTFRYLKNLINYEIRAKFVGTGWDLECKLRELVSLRMLGLLCFSLFYSDFYVWFSVHHKLIYIKNQRDATWQYVY